jgi:hypothetical protein
MSTKNKKVKTRVKIVLGFLGILFLFSFFMGNKKGKENNSTHPYPQEVKAAIDSSLKFFDKVDSTLNVFKKDFIHEKK